MLWLMSSKVLLWLISDCRCLFSFWDLEELRLVVGLFRSMMWGLFISVFLILMILCCLWFRVLGFVLVNFCSLSNLMVLFILVGRIVWFCISLVIVVLIFWDWVLMVMFLCMVNLLKSFVDWKVWVKLVLVWWWGEKWLILVLLRVIDLDVWVNLVIVLMKVVLFVLFGLMSLMSDFFLMVML